MSIFDDVTTFILGPADVVEEAAPQKHAEDLGDLSLGDPSLAAWLQMQGYPEPEINDDRARGLTAYWRASRLIADTIASLPLKSYQRDADGTVRRITTWLDNPAGPYAAGDVGPFTWLQWIMGGLTQRGEIFVQHVYNGAGQLIGGLPVPKNIVSVKWVTKGDRVFKLFSVSRGSHKDIYESDSPSIGMSHILAFSEDGLHGLSPLSIFRRTLGTAAAGEEAASRSFRGALMAGMITADEDIPGEESEDLAAAVESKFNGTHTAGQVLFANRKLKFTPWAMSAVDAQFLESRAFMIEEIARMFGLPIHLLSVAGAVSNWGTGIAENNVSLQKYTLVPYTKPIEDALARLLPPGQWVEFDWKGLLTGTPAEQTKLVLEEYDADLLTLNEARGLIGLTHLPDGDRMKSQTPKATGGLPNG